MLASHIATNRQVRKRQSTYKLRAIFLGPCLDWQLSRLKDICLNLIILQLRTCFIGSSYYLTWFPSRLHSSVLSKVITSKGGQFTEQEKDWKGYQGTGWLHSRTVTLVQHFEHQSILMRLSQIIHNSTSTFLSVPYMSVKCIRCAIRVTLTTYCLI